MKCSANGWWLLVLLGCGCHSSTSDDPLDAAPCATLEGGISSASAGGGDSRQITSGQIKLKGAPLPDASADATPSSGDATPSSGDAAVGDLRGRFLSDLLPTASSNGLGPVESDRTNGDSALWDGRTLSLRGSSYAKGLGMHAPADVTYAVPAGCSAFDADVGVDDDAGGRGSIGVQVWVDGHMSFESPTLSGTAGPQPVHVDLAGGRELRLVVRDAGDGNALDHADWGGARLSCSGGSAPSIPRKKVIEYGWDCPTARFLSESISEQPFDGVIFKLKDGEPHHAFETHAWQESEMSFDALSRINWGGLTDNFLILWSTNKWAMNWYDDDQWRIIVQNLRLYGRAAQAAHAKGVVFDTEAYGADAFQPDVAPGKAPDDVARQVRKRGAEFVQALQSEVPNLTLLLMMGLTVERVGWGRRFLPAFIDGLLDGAGEHTTIVDGNEPSYYYTDTNDFFDVADWFKGAKGAGYLSPENQPKLGKSLQLGHALYVDGVLGGNPDATRRMLWEHDVYEGLLTSDQYVWLYSENMDWWKHQVTPGVTEGLLSARQKLSGSGGLGFDLVGGKTTFNPIVITAGTKVMAPSLSVASLLRAASSNLGGQLDVHVQVSDDTSGSVSLLFDNRKLAGRDLPPYDFTVRALPAGKHTLVARFFGPSGSHTSSPPLTVETGP